MRAYLQIAALLVIATTLAVANSSADPAPPSIGVAAFAADRAGNYAEALRLFRMIDAQSDAAFAGEASVDYFTAQRMGRGAQNYHFQAYHFFSTRSGAREKIGEYYEKELGGVNQDYRTAAIYYAKATDKSNGDAPSIRATLRLAFLYANGLGVPRDRAKARELLVSTGPSTQANVVLLDHNLLRRSMEDVTPSLLQTASALSV
jgi:TPR repeat protein